MKKQKYLTPKRISLLALFCALVVVATIIIRLPIPATGGYFNLGDTIIFIASVLLGPVFAMIVGGVGSALADVIGGFAQYAPWTLVIKGIEGLIAGLLVLAFRADPKTMFGTLLTVVSFVIAGLWMTAGYFGAEYIIYSLDWAPPMAELPFNLAQGGISAVIAGILAPIVARTFGERLSN
ncbi:MAG: ECF transporter S component [Deltaproteobacteria bacterium]|nr:ECF transporter S component [Candidatus Zymogenaceae bacterium]